ncbi:LysO family transporter [Olsenella uli]|uniref:LysO family transporter n=1 Tax=Olsenella uli TaxID=133926 RepID=UPI00195C1953|nr:LysO family transporter [Olsenella uli]MBM6675715.1 LysO family transporter [Olsenella uli]
MLTVVLMCAGALIGRFLLPPWWVRGNSRVQAALTVLLIFTMGVSIGRNDDLFGDLGSIGLDGALFCLIPMAASVALVHLLARRALGVGKGR